MELLLVHREPHPLDELAGGVHDLLLELRAGYGTGAGGVPEHDPVVLGEGSLGDVSAARIHSSVMSLGKVLHPLSSTAPSFSSNSPSQSA